MDRIVNTSQAVIRLENMAIIRLFSFLASVAGFSPQFRRDPIHGGQGVVEEALESRAQVIQARLAVRGADQAVLRAFPPAIAQIRARAAILGQRLGFGVAELDLRG